MRDHKSLLAWREAHEVARAVLRCSRTAWRPHAAALFTQLQRSSLSAQLNITEGYSLIANNRFPYHLRVAYGSAVETADLLELALEESLLPEPDVHLLLERCRKSQRLILGLLRRYCASLPRT
ncbi:MAG TPA: four helix bundle protein [Gemmatimonadales bacterium]